MIVRKHFATTCDVKKTLGYYLPIMARKHLAATYGCKETLGY
jgi:hypothetical protein